MTDMPETIWAERLPICGDEWWTDAPTPFGMETLTKYRRADLPPVVKPLMWDDADEICTRFRAPALGGNMMVVELDVGSGIYSAGFDVGGLAWKFIQAEYPSGFGGVYSAPAKFASIEAAKAAAQADYTARILSALVTQ